MHEPSRPRRQRTPRAFEVYQRELAARGWVDFDDLIALPLRLLKGNPDLADHYRSRYRWVSVDEYQDIDAAQYRLVRLLVPADGNLCVIGDPDQAIYGFRGAEVGYFQRFREDFPAARTIALTRNYRSTQTIVDAALQLIAPSSLVADRRLEAHGLGPEQIEIHACTTDRAEAEFVVHIDRAADRRLDVLLARQPARGRATRASRLSFADFAVLYRTEAQADALAEALERSGMPFQRRSHKPLGDEPSVQAVIRAMGEVPDGGAARHFGARSCSTRRRESVGEKDRQLGSVAARAAVAGAAMRKRPAAVPLGTGFGDGG